MEKRLTDKEIVKALEWHLNNENNCAECPLVVIKNSTTYCVDVLLQNTLDLINRLQAEKQNLEIELKAMRGAANSYKAENERLLQELQYPQADTVQPMSEENIVHCKECKHLMFSDFEGECSKGYKGIVRPNDSCPFGVRERGESK